MAKCEKLCAPKAFAQWRRQNKIGKEKENFSNFFEKFFFIMY
jgi:hypothetical protein